MTETRSTTPLFRVEGIGRVFQASTGLFRRRPVVAARDVSFDLRRGEAVALVGESGSGKSTIGRILLRLERADTGRIFLDGEDVLATQRRHASLAYRRRVQMIFQDPFGSLNPVHPVGHHVVRPLLRHGRATRETAREKAMEVLRTVGLEPAEDFIDRHPYELSGGQRQRVAIARAIAVEPDVLVADEPTSMLDVSMRMDVLDLLARLRTERNMALLLITHDLASARYVADRILVLFRGRVVEEGPTEAVVSDPRHPYTRALLGAIAGASHRRTAARAAATAPGSVPGPDLEDEVIRLAAAGTGCPFRPRCPEATEECGRVDPEPRTVGTQRVRCHLYPARAAAGANA